MTDQLPTKDVNDAPWPVWCEAVQDDIYYASEIDQYIQHLRDELAREVGTREARVAEIERLRTALTGISTCSTCEACRGAALRALRGEVPSVRKPDKFDLAFEIMEAENMETCNPDWCPTCTKPYAECRCNGVAW